MEENPPRFQRKDGTHIESSSSKSGPSQKNTCTCRHTTTSSASAATTSSSGVEGGGDRIECSGKYCGPCTAGLIADCVALCCCPCALINIFAFTFVKLPWMVGRKCVGKVKKKKKKSKTGVDYDQTAEDEEGDADGNSRKKRVEDGILLEIVGSEEMGGFEAERVWLELYKDGHLGFGRVSFTGIQ